MQNLANQLPDAFVDTKKVTKSHIPAVNAPARIDIPEGQLANESQIRLKRGRPVGSKDSAPRKRRTQRGIDTLEEVHGKQKTPTEVYIEQGTLEEVRDKEITPEEAHVHENHEISINYVHNNKKWDRNKVIINNIFAFQVASDIIKDDQDPEPQNVEECRHRNDWPK